MDKYLEINSNLSILIFNCKNLKKQYLNWIQEIDNNINIIIIGNEVQNNKIKDNYYYLYQPVNYSNMKMLISKILLENLLILKNSLVLKNAKGYYKVNKSEIMYIEICSRYTIVNTLQSKISTYITLKKFQEILGKGFFRCHIGYLVNLSYIKSVNKSSIYLLTDTEIPLSKNRKVEFRQVFESYSKRVLLK